MKKNDIHTLRISYPRNMKKERGKILKLYEAVGRIFVR